MLFCVCVGWGLFLGGLCVLEGFVVRCVWVGFFVFIQEEANTHHGLVTHLTQCSTTGVTKAVVCAILSVGWCIYDSLMLIENSSP